MLCTEDLQLCWKLLQTYRKLERLEWWVKNVLRPQFQAQTVQKCALKTIGSCKDWMIGNGSFGAIVRTFQTQMAKENI